MEKPFGRENVDILIEEFHMICMKEYKVASIIVKDFLWLAIEQVFSRGFDIFNNWFRAIRTIMNSKNFPKSRTDLHKSDPHGC